MEITDLKNIRSLYFNFDLDKNIFLKKEYISDFYISKELLKLTDILEKNKIKYKVDEYSNIVVFTDF